LLNEARTSKSVPVRQAANDTLKLIKEVYSRENELEEEEAIDNAIRRDSVTGSIKITNFQRVTEVDLTSKNPQPEQDEPLSDTQSLNQSYDGKPPRNGPSG
jgi:hypothetical protein